MILVGTTDASDHFFLHPPVPSRYMAGLEYGQVEYDQSLTWSLYELGDAWTKDDLAMDLTQPLSPKKQLSADDGAGFVSTPGQGAQATATLFAYLDPARRTYFADETSRIRYWQRLLLCSDLNLRLKPPYQYSFHEQGTTNGRTVRSNKLIFEVIMTGLNLAKYFHDEQDDALAAGEILTQLGRALENIKDLAKDVKSALVEAKLDPIREHVKHLHHLVNVQAIASHAYLQKDALTLFQLCTYLSSRPEHWLAVLCDRLKRYALYFRALAMESTATQLLNQPHIDAGDEDGDDDIPEDVTTVFALYTAASTLQARTTFGVRVGQLTRLHVNLDYALRNVKEDLKLANSLALKAFEPQTSPSSGWFISQVESLRKQYEESVASSYHRISPLATARPHEDVMAAMDLLRKTPRVVKTMPKRIPNRAPSSTPRTYLDLVRAAYALGRWDERGRQARPGSLSSLHRSNELMVRLGTALDVAGLTEQYRLQATEDLFIDDSEVIKK